MVVYTMKGESPTLGGLINGLLFENGASFAACIAPHPESGCLDVHVETEEEGREVDCLRSSLLEAGEMVDCMLRNLSAHEEETMVVDGT